ncbi:MAG TPA: orotidine-5'-phosphate decarboxylase [Marmoricola sp.]
MGESFGARLRRAMDERGPLCAGIDPHAGLLRDWGLPETVAGVERFAMTAAEALGSAVAAIKPQSAFFERFGSAGIAVLERTIETARAGGAQVILDVKRGDIGSTAQAYADAYLDRSSPLACDCITASPFLGFGSLTPMFDTARANDAGVLVLALTSNPEGPEVQAAGAGETTVAGLMLAHLAAANAGAEPMGSFGAVVGATIEPPSEDLAINGPLLAPGVGAQGGDAASVRAVFDGVLDLVLPSVSRSLLKEGPDPAKLADAARRQAEEMAAMVASGVA